MDHSQGGGRKRGAYRALQIDMYTFVTPSHSPVCLSLRRYDISFIEAITFIDHQYQLEFILIIGASFISASLFIISNTRHLSEHVKHVKPLLIKGFEWSRYFPQKINAFLK